MQYTLDLCSYLRVLRALLTCKPLSVDHIPAIPVFLNPTAALILIFTYPEIFQILTTKHKARSQQTIPPSFLVIPLLFSFRHFVATHLASWDWPIIVTPNRAAKNSNPPTTFGLSGMPKKLVCVIGSEMYANHARLLASQMVNNRVDQRAIHIQAEVPLSTAPKPPQPTGLRVLLSRKQRTNQVSGPPPYAKVLSDAYWELSEIYQPGDEIVLFIVTGVEADWEFLRTTARVLAEHLEAGTEPTRVAPDSRSSVDSDEDIFGDRTREEPTNHMLGRRVECSLVIVYRSESRVTEINNSLLRESPLSVNQIFSFNWATGHENYCDTHRDERGQVICREVSYYKQIQWHLPAVTNATMSFIRYTPKHIEAWKSLKPSTPQTLVSLPSPLTPEYPPSPSIVTPPTPPRPRFSWSMARRSTTRSGTLSSIRSPRRSSTLMSGFTTVPRSDSLMSSFTATPLVSSPMPLESFTGSPASSRSSTILTQPSNLTESSRTSMDSDFPALREAYNSLPGMTKHQVWSYPGFGKHNDDHALPERVVWRSSRE